MDNIPKYLLWVVGIIFTLGVITAGVSWWNNSIALRDVVNRQQLEETRMVVESEYSAFDNQIVSGSQILTAYRRYSTQDPFYLYVQTNQSGVKNFAVQPSQVSQSCQSFDYAAGKLQGGNVSCTATDATMQQYGNQFYIPPQARFISKIIRDENDHIAGIYFKAQ